MSDDAEPVVAKSQDKVESTFGARLRIQVGGGGASEVALISPDGLERTM
jgi:hypothetical protein